VIGYDADGPDDGRAGSDFSGERAVRHAEFIAEAGTSRAACMIEGAIGWPPPLASDAS
jgi:hypothetical protein